MKILLTNDDGYRAPGLAALAGIARDFASELWIVAPSVEQSYAGHRITTRDVLSAVEHAPGCYHVNGTPADCVRIALRGLHLMPDLVLAGINQGGNLGIDVYSSGTVAASREAAALGIPAIAISQFVDGRVIDWARAARLAARVVGQLRSRPAGSREYWNVNLPHPGPDAELDTIECVECGVDPHPQDVRFTQAESGGYLYSGRYRERPREAGRDVEVCFGGRISISRLAL